MAAYANARAEVNGHWIRVRCDLDAPAGSELGWQVFDAENGRWVTEGEWRPASPQADLQIQLPGAAGRYHVYLSLRDDERGWWYERGRPFVLLESLVQDRQITVERLVVSTRRRLAMEAWPSRAVRVFTEPWQALVKHRGLMRSLIRRELLARYRGSFGDLLWTVVSPLLLMLTYYFVFGLVLRSRFAGDPSPAGFVLYFLAGMLPWLAISESLARAPVVLHENRNLIQKLVFPVEVLPLNQTALGLVTSGVAMTLFLALLWLLRGSVPVSAFALPLILLPQLLLTAGLAWALAALGVFVRDLAHLMSFALNLWFFLTPICYDGRSLPPSVAPVLARNPLFVLVGQYRRVLLEGLPPEWIPLAKLYALGLVVFFGGYAWFARSRKWFADSL
ncbi:MAG: ABC transporter permease [Bryobacteraceae bacterium]|nr:ABC transporter permease [Bryobacteraceae bacterium]